MNTQIVKDLEFIKWHLNNKTHQEVEMVVDVLIKRYSPKPIMTDVGDPADANMCDSCQ